MTHTPILPHTHSLTRIPTHSRTHTYNPWLFIHSYTHIHMHKHAHTHARTHKAVPGPLHKSRICIYIHTCARTHIHTQWSPVPWNKHTYTSSYMIYMKLILCILYVLTYCIHIHFMYIYICTSCSLSLARSLTRALSFSLSLSDFFLSFSLPPPRPDHSWHGIHV